MPQYAFYYEAREKEKLANVELSEQEEKDRRHDYEEIMAERQHQERFHPFWKMGGSLYNVVQEPMVDDIPNFPIGLTRSIIDFGVTVMNQGQPEFDFDPVGEADIKKVILWKALVDHILSTSDWRVHQERWITDMLIFGSGAIEAFNETPMRRRRYEKPDGSVESRIVRDFRRSKVGLRHRDIFHTWRNPFVENPYDVPTGGRRIIMTHNQFVQNIKNVYLPNGKPKYKNLTKIPTAPKYAITIRYDEIEDVYRMYCIPFGSGAQAEWLDPSPDNYELGIPIFDKPLTKYRLTVDGKEVSGGANVPGMTPLCFGTFADQLDGSYETHAVYGMGIGQLIQGHEKMLGGTFNMTFQNLQYKNTVVLSYKSLTGEQPDVDNIDYFDTGRLIPGEFTPQSLGIADVASNQVLWEWTQNFAKMITGFTYDQLIDIANAGTAFQAGLQVRANNMRVRQRLTSLENGPLKRAGLLLLANALSEVTVDEWEELTETQVKEIAERIRSGAESSEDYDMDSTPPKRRVVSMIPVKGRKFREDFSKSKTRKLDYQGTENTLIEDPDLPGDTSRVPAVREYLWPSRDIESILQFDCRPDAKSMLFDLKAQESGEVEKLLAKIIELKTAVNASGEVLFDDPQVQAVIREWLNVNNIDESTVFPDEEDGSAMLKAARKVKEELEALSSSQNAQPAQLPVGSPAGQPVPPAQQSAAQPQGPVPGQGAAPAPPRMLAELAGGQL